MREPVFLLALAMVGFTIVTVVKSITGAIPAEVREGSWASSGSRWRSREPPSKRPRRPWPISRPRSPSYRSGSTLPNGCWLSGIGARSGRDSKP